MFFLLLGAAHSSTQLPVPPIAPLVGARSLSLSPNGKRLAFSYQGDVWVAPSEGGRAIPLTSNVEMDDNPIWSPDGRYVAFASNRTGNWDIFIVPSEGGQTSQLTFHSGADVPSDWSPDGKRIIERASRDSAYNGLYEIDVRTGKTTKLLQDMMSVGSPHYSPDGKTILYTRFGFPWTRPRYEGSAAAQLWKLDISTGRRSPVANTGFQHLWPSYGSNGDVFTVTVQDKTRSSSPVGHPIPKIAASDNPARTPNVYRIGSGLKRLTNFVGEGARFLTVARNAPVAAFERDGDVFVMQQDGAPRKIEITAGTDEKTAMRERLVLNGGAQSPALSPKGDKVAFAAHNTLWWMPTKHGKGPNADDATRITDWYGLNEDPIWSPDGAAIYYLSDKSGPLHLYRWNATSKATTEVPTPGDVAGVRFTPDRSRLSFWVDGPLGGLYTMPVSGGVPARILAKPGKYRGGEEQTTYDWSPDGRYVAYSDILQRSGYYYWENTTNIWLYDTQTKAAPQDVTRLSANHGLPRFTADGNYLMMVSDRDGAGIYAIPLHQEDAAPGEIEMKFEKPAGVPPVKIEMEGIDDRPRRILSAQVDGDLRLDPTTGDIYYLVAGDLYRAKFDGTEPKKLTAGGGISMFRPSDDFTQVVADKSGAIVTVDVKKPDTPSTTIPFRADYLHDLNLEHLAAFNQFWRAYNQNFYDPNFHGRDWAELANRYRRLLPSVGHRNEMATVLGEMVGEMESSHSEVGPAAGNPRSETSAHPGFTFDYSFPGPGIKILEVPHGVPGSYTKTKLEPGELVTAINGKNVSLDEALWRDVLNEQVGRTIELTVTARDGKTRKVSYKAMSAGEFNGIVNRNLLEARRKRVEELSHGTVTYVHIAGMDQRSLDRFNQEVWEYAQGKKAVIIDVRNNGGGNTADLLINILERQPNMIYQPRDEQPVLGPGRTLAVPMAVLMGETSYSNAEMFPAAMRARKLATLVGMPTPGYVIYTGGFQLVDGTIARMPGTGVYQLNGTPLEDNGQVPDVKVDLTPEQFFKGEDPQLDAAVKALERRVGSR